MNGEEMGETIKIVNTHLGITTVRANHGEFFCTQFIIAEWNSLPDAATAALPKYDFRK